MAYNVSYDFQGGETVGSVIGAAHFGTNYLFHHDRVGSDSTFPEIIDRVGIDLIRYPGGTVTEEYFDISNPQASVQSSSFGRKDKAVTPIHEFLEYAAESGSRAIIVLPTYRYFDEATRQIDPAAEAIFKDFVRAVLAGDYGEAQISGFEIGNEWYQDKFSWTATEFGEVQSKIGLWIDEVIRENDDWADTGVYVQSGRGDDDGNGIEDDQELAAQFTAQELEAVDGLISHFYASTGSGNPLILGGSVNRRLKETAKHWDTSDETGLDLIVTEWNIGGDGPDNTSVTGLMRNVALLNVFSNMMENGVDMSAIWTAQAPGPASLSNREGDDHLTSTGYLYRMMRRELVDTQAVETVQGDEILAGDGQAIGRTYVFQGEGKTVIYLASGVGETINLNVDFSEYMTAGSHIHATVLGTADGASAADYRVEASMRTISNGAIGDGGSHMFTLGDYELVQVVITHGAGVRLFGDDQNATDDSFDGSAHDDEIWGLDGDDEINGFGGDDLINGGAGDDALSGGDGADTFTGGEGSDTIDGGTGEDTLDYSDSASAVRIYAREGIAEEDGTGETDEFVGIEHFIGSDHADTIFIDETTASVDSGAGDDFVRMLGGDDVLVITGDGNDFVLIESGTATVDLGAGNDKLLAHSADVNVNGGAGSDVIHGGSGNDTIDGGQGNDVLYGGSGQDTFVYKSDGGTDTILDFDTSQDILDLTDLDITFADIDVVSTDRGVELRVAGESIVELQSVTADEVATDMFAL
ncbi:cellulase family glycosylhydrolase [Roseovarius sp. CAU 1744]|uniref:calcium-binding protein n=1 Tax=Roseovarius sp. CAU 1744 TaxID=3140368 RepID=UPI00325C2E50